MLYFNNNSNIDYKRKIALILTEVYKILKQKNPPANTLFTLSARGLKVMLSFLEYRLLYRVKPEAFLNRKGHYHLSDISVFILIQQYVLTAIPYLLTGYSSRLFSFIRKSYILMVVIPFSSLVTFTTSFTTMIFLNESLT